MKSSTNYKWIKYLPEVGAPVRDAANEIQRVIDQANAALEAAKVAHEQAMEYAASQAKSLDTKISSLWTAKEISAAKRGVMICADGTEIKCDW